MHKFLFMTLVSAMTLSAADTHSYQLTPTFGKSFSDESSKMTNTEVLYGLRGSWQSKDAYGVELGFESGSNVKYDNREETTTLSRLFGHITLHGETSYNIAPYFLIGAGYEFLGTNIEDEPDQNFLTSGVGFDYQVSTYLNLSLEVKALYKLDTEDMDYSATFGCSVLFDDNFTINKSGSPFQKAQVILNVD